jgi:hypothetical protein
VRAVARMRGSPDSLGNRHCADEPYLGMCPYRYYRPTTVPHTWGAGMAFGRSEKRPRSPGMAAEAPAPDAAAERLLPQLIRPMLTRDAANLHPRRLEPVPFAR